MNVITHYSNWGGWDQLDGTTINDGEPLLIEWPDGYQMEIRAKVVDEGMPISDHGNSYIGSYVCAYATISIHGALVDVRLLGMKGQRL